MLPWGSLASLRVAQVGPLWASLFSEVILSPSSFSLGFVSPSTSFFFFLPSFIHSSGI